MPVRIISPVSPRTRNGDSTRTLSPRPGTLSGHVLGIVWNRLGRSDVFFRALGERLTESEGLVGVVWVAKPSQSVPPAAEDWRRLRVATVAIAGFGGCGSCSARSMRDVLELDWTGIPGTFVGHRALMASARAVAELSGHPDYPMVLTDYPYAVTASWTDEEAHHLAADLAPRVAAALVSAGVPPSEVSPSARIAR